MRRLLYIPIIHDEADLGSAGKGLAQGSAALSGEGRWMSHQETMTRFWEVVASYLGSLDPSQLKVYQDGLVADGQAGRRIVEEAARRGSRNYQLLLRLLERGAELRKTEDPVLLLREHENLRRSAQPEAVEEGQRGAERYRRQRDRLMEERDRFIAEAINSTLKEGEVGVLFIGAQHNLVPRLAADISVELVKDPEKIRAYFAELFLGHDDRRLEELGRYLSAPVSSLG